MSPVFNICFKHYIILYIIFKMQTQSTQNHEKNILNDLYSCIMLFQSVGISWWLLVCPFSVVHSQTTLSVHLNESPGNKCINMNWHKMNTISLTMNHKRLGIFFNCFSFETSDYHSLIGKKYTMECSHNGKTINPLTSC